MGRRGWPADGVLDLRGQPRRDGCRCPRRPSGARTSCLVSLRTGSLRCQPSSGAADAAAQREPVLDEVELVGVEVGGAQVVALPPGDLGAEPPGR